MPMSYDYYHVFYYVGKYHSFTRAAQKLMSSQPNVTRAMNNLEAQLNCKLFIRLARGVELTDEGKMLYSHAEIAFEHLTLGETEIAHVNSLQSGELVIAASEIALQKELLPALKKFRGLYPGISIRIGNYSTPRRAGCAAKRACRGGGGIRPAGKSAGAARDHAFGIPRSAGGRAVLRPSGPCPLPGAPAGGVSVDLAAARYRNLCLL